MVELFEHTADLGIRASAPTLDELFTEVARGLTLATTDEPGSIRLTQTVPFTIAGDEREFLLFDLLREQLRLLEMEQFLTGGVTVNFLPSGIEVVYHGEPLDRSRHPLSHEVKAITYHGLEIVADGGNFRAEVIVDI